MDMFLSIFEQGMLWSLLGVALFISFRILKFPDLTVEGSLPLGAAICVKFIVAGVDPLLATFLACIGGSVLGAITGLLHIKLNVPILLAGILTMSASYSINLRIMGSANLALKDLPTIFSYNILQSISPAYLHLVVATVIAILIVCILNYVLYSNLGQTFIVSGDNEIMAQSIGINTDTMKIFGLVISNGIVSLVGAIVAQSNSFADIGMGVGTIVIALVSIIIMELLLPNLTLFQRMFSILFGSIIYRYLIYLVLELGLNQSDINLISSVLLACCFIIPYTQDKLKKRKTNR